MVAAGLRLWAAGVHADEAALTGAAVELVVRACGGEFTDPGWPWIREGSESDPLGLVWLDPAAMSVWKGGQAEHAVMDFIEALAGGRPVRWLPDLLRVLDRPTRRLVLAAFDYAAADRRDVAVYAFGGDPWQLVDNLSPASRFWPPNELNALGQPGPARLPRLKVAGVAQ